MPVSYTHLVCGGSFLVKAQNSEQAATAQSEVNAALIVNDKVVKDTVTTKDEPVKTELSLSLIHISIRLVQTALLEFFHYYSSLYFQTPFAKIKAQHTVCLLYTSRCV